MNTVYFGCNIIELSNGPDEYENVLKNTNQIKGIALDYALSMAIYTDKVVIVTFSVGGLLDSVRVDDHYPSDSSSWSPTKDIELAKELISKYHPDAVIVEDNLIKQLQEIVINRIGTEILIPKMKYR